MNKLLTSIILILLPILLQSQIKGDSCIITSKIYTNTTHINEPNWVFEKKITQHIDKNGQQYTAVHNENQQLIYSAEISINNLNQKSTHRKEFDTNGELMLEEKYEYNDKGLKTITLDPTKDYVFDEDGRIVEIYTKSAGEAFGKTSISYKENIQIESEYLLVSYSKQDKTGDSIMKKDSFELFAETEFHYNPFNQLIQEKTYDEDGKLAIHQSYKYDNKRNEIFSKYYFYKKLSTISKNKYDEQNRLVKCVEISYRYNKNIGRKREKTVSKYYFKTIGNQEIELEKVNNQFVQKIVTEKKCF